MSNAPHLTAEELGRLHAREASAADYRRAVRHLLSGCPRCAFAVRALVGQFSGKALREADYDPVLDVFHRRLKALLEEAAIAEGGQL